MGLQRVIHDWVTELNWTQGNFWNLKKGKWWISFFPIFSTSFKHVYIQNDYLSVNLCPSLFMAIFLEYGLTYSKCSKMSNKWMNTNWISKSLVLDINMFWIISILKSHIETVIKTALLSSFLAIIYVLAHKNFVCVFGEWLLRLFTIYCFFHAELDSLWNMFTFWCFGTCLLLGANYTLGRSPKISLEQPLSASHKICSWNGSFFYSGNMQ